MKSRLLTLVTLMLCLLATSSCRDEDWFSAPGAGAGVSRASSDDATSGLVLQSDGTWKATRRVPLVGMGRVVDNCNAALVTVGNLKENASVLVDNDLTNSFSGQSIVGANVVADAIVSIRDLNYVYSGGQKVGFLCKNLNNQVLNLSVLKGFWVNTYLKGELKDHKLFTDATSVLDLGLGNIAGGADSLTFAVEINATQPFDEVRIGGTGVTADVLSSLSIYYAYVGENPMIPAIKSSSYFSDGTGVSAEGPYFDISLKRLTDDNLDNGIEMGTVSNLFQPHVAVNFGKEIPAGDEVGFYVTAGSVLDLGVGKTILIKTYDKEGNEVERYSYTKAVALSLLGGGKYIYSLTTSKPCWKVQIDFLGVNVDLGSAIIHYAFVREKTTLDASSLFAVSNVTVYNPNYRFADPTTGTITNYELLEQPQQSSGKITKTDYGWYIKGMNIPGDYKIRAHYKAEDGSEYTKDFKVTRLQKQILSCAKELVNGDNENVYTASFPSGFEAQIGASNTKGYPSYLVDSNLENCLEFDKGLKISLAGDQGLVEVEASSSSGGINPENKNIRVGFVVNKSKGVLNLSLLKFLRIKLYDNNGAVVTSGLAHDNNGVSLGLIKDSKNKARLTINTTSNFYKVALYCTGGIEVDLGDVLQVYYAFTEDAENSDCGNPGEECMQMIGNSNYGAKVTVPIASGASVASMVYDLSNAVDDDINSRAVVAGPVQLGAATTVIADFNTIKANQEVGFILSNLTAVANAEIIEFVEIRAYNGDKVVLKANEKGSGIDLNVAGSGDRFYYSVTPPEDFNRLELIFGEGISIKEFFINGIYIRPTDENGVEECVEDEVLTNISKAYADAKDICQGENPNIRVEGGQTGKTYSMEIHGIGTNNSSYNSGKINVQINATDHPGYLSFVNSKGAVDTSSEDEFWANLPAGEYAVTIYDGTEVQVNLDAAFNVHPHETTWKTNATSKDWNDYDNWSNGAPYECTNVILPSGCTQYPELVEGGSYYCNNIHFEDGAELVGQTHLHYSGIVTIDKKISKVGSYILMSAPLKGMVTGDMFIPSSTDLTTWNTWRTTVDNEIHTNYFSAVQTSYPENRSNPLIYQRFFSKAVYNAVMTRAAETDPLIAGKEADWSRSFNAVNTPYNLGQGFALKLEKGNSTASEFVLHFPKSFTTYNYYALGGTTSLQTGSVARSDNSGKFMVDKVPCEIDLERKDEGTDFLFGNPFVAHIDIAAFLAGNQTTVEKLQVFNGTSFVDATTGTISPMDAVLLVAKDKGNGLTIELTDKMLKQQPSAITRTNKRR